MKIIHKYCIGLLFLFLLAGCIGENYDFSPPAVKLSSHSNIESEGLVESNIDWIGENNNQIEKETQDIGTLAKKQQQMFFKAGEEVDLLFEHADFDPKGLTVAVWQNDKKVDLEVSDISFNLPKDKGEYVIEVNLQTDRGFAQYIGNLETY